MSRVLPNLKDIQKAMRIVEGNDIMNGYKTGVNQAQNQLTETVNNSLSDVSSSLNTTKEEFIIIKNSFLMDFVDITNGLIFYLMGSIIVSIIMLIVYMFDKLNKPFLFLGLVINTIIVGVLVFKNYARLARLPFYLTTKLKEIKSVGIDRAKKDFKKAQKNLTEDLIYNERRKVFNDVQHS